MFTVFIYSSTVASVTDSYAQIVESYRVPFKTMLGFLGWNFPIGAQGSWYTKWGIKVSQYYDTQPLGKADVAGINHLRNTIFYCITT